MSCLILSRLVKTVMDSFVKLVCWSDSMDCICWINTRSKVWNRFVQNRVKEIRANLPVAEWKYCPGENNPADIPSRGNYLSHADVQKNWLQDPEFLLHSHEFWPKLPDASNVVNNESIDNDNPMAGEVISVHSITNKPSGVNDVISISSFNSFKTLVLVTSDAFRFI